ncbi:hypothetical protein EON83_21375 [bacterium]|nr:MAG: hypothetical protein EON83_21375 [bacterium]
MQLSPSDSFDFEAPTRGAKRPKLTLLAQAQNAQKGISVSPVAATSGEEETDFGNLSGPSIWIDTETVRDYYAHWIDDCAAECQSPRTIEAKRDTLEKFVWFLDREKSKRVSLFEIRRFLTHAKNGHTGPLGRWDSNTPRSFKPVGGRAVQLYFIYLRGFFAWLVECELARANPLEGKKQPKAAKNHISPFAIEEVAALLNAVPRGLNRARNEAIIYFLLDTGVRVSELCSLRVDEVDLARRVAVVTGKGNKTREVWFGPDTSRVLRKYLSKHPRQADARLFYSARPDNPLDGITPTALQHTLKRLGEVAGISTRRVSPHTFRHTFATEFIRSGGTPKALQMLLGHEDMTMTYKYVTLADADAAEQHRQHSPARLLRTKGKKK